ncbi:MAG TPA: hypothetical protein VF551_05150, partial [Chthoniobacterales bacterium]
GDPERIVVGLGPGSYAGTRIAIAAAIGLQTATGSELIGLPSICALPGEATEYGVIGDARRQSFYCATIRERAFVSAPELHSSDEIASWLSAFQHRVYSTEPLAGFEDVTLAYPSAAILAHLGARSRMAATPPPILEPIYLREPHITQPKVSAR